MMAEGAMASTSEHRSSLDGATSSSRRSNISDLEGMCLSAIAANFDRFSAAFKMRNSIVPPKHIEFLARRFSETLFNMMKCDRTLKPEYFDFLINPHFKELDLVGIDVDLLPALSHKLKKGNNVLSCKAVSENGWNAYPCVLSSLENVECLSFKKCNLPVISNTIENNCHSLKVFECDTSLFSYENHYINSVCAILKGCHHLEVFSADDTIGAVHKMHKVNWLEKRFKKKVPRKTKKYSLKTLSSTIEYQEYPLHDALELCAEICPYTTSLSLSYVNEKELNSCLNFPCLESVTIRRFANSISMDSLKEFLNITGMKLLSLRLPFYPSMDMRHLVECCPNLRSLVVSKKFSFNDMTKFGKKLGSIADLHFLRTLTLIYFTFEEEEDATALKLILRPNNSIEILGLIFCDGLTKELFSNLDMLRVKELNVSGSDIGPGVVKKLLLIPDLQKLNVEDCILDCFDIGVRYDDPRITGHVFRKNRYRIVPYDRDERTACFVPVRWH